MSDLHLAIIMDGNGRWARRRDLPRWRGHAAGVMSIRDVVRSAPGLGIDTLTLDAFSADNWKRPATEVGRLFWLLRRYAAEEREDLLAKGVRVTMIGRRDRIPRSALQQLELTEEATRGCERLHLRLAVDYSSRCAIIDGVRKTIQSGCDVDLDTLGASIRGPTRDPDLIVRTAGERRLSDFLLWEAAYSELYFTPKCWPDFRASDLAAALQDFGRRDRRFGGLPATIEEERLAG